MTSFFRQILEKNKLSQHDGRPLWKYNLSESDFVKLKSFLSNINYYDLDPRDITLHYAEWWKNEYKGGAPRKIDVYNSIKPHYITFANFYKYAKDGAKMLGIKWIKRENRLYFRTLLLQGGLPINHLLNPDYSGVYTRFLKKVLELNPSSIDEFAYEYDIISILPPSSRNEAIYESCLNIVDAIWNGNEGYLDIFNSRGGSNISKELQEHKETIDKKIKKSSKFKAFWVLRNEYNIYQIKLMFNFPKIIEIYDFSELISVKQEELKSEYQLVINDLLVCKFRKNTEGNFKVFWFNNSNIFWNGHEMKPDIYLSSSDGERFPFLIRFIDYPQLSIPTLWTQKSENEWMLQKGKHCPQDEAFILYPDNWNLESDFKVKKIELSASKINWCGFSKQVQLTNNDEKITFKTNKTSFEWFIQENKPKWIVKSNLPIITQAPRIIVYDKEGKHITKPKLSWRLKGDTRWQEGINSIPNGCIEYKMEANDCEEQDVFYKIGNFDIEFQSDNPQEAIITIHQSNGLDFKIKKEQNELKINKENNSFQIKLHDINKMPKSIKAVIEERSQNRNLHIEIVPPFHGVKILDPFENTLQDEAILLFGHFIGYRFYTPINYHNYFIKIYNTNREYINIIKKLPNGITPLREYEEISKRMFRLTDAMDKNSSVTIELIDENNSLLSKYMIKNYNCILTYNFIDNNLEIKTNGDNSINLSLSAIPLDCHPDNIITDKLFQENNIYTFPDNILLDKFIVVSEYDEENNSILLPCFISKNENNTPTTINDRKLRISRNKDELLLQDHNEISWQKVKKYFDICIEYDLPFSTFDFLRAASSSPELIAKMFCFLSIYNPDNDFTDKTCQILEEDLGFSFHWIPKKYWENAIQWLNKSFLITYNQNQTNLIIKEINNSIFEVISNSEPVEWFNKVADFTINNNIYKFNRFVLNEEIRTLRQNLGEKVLNELPEICPKIPEGYKPILSVTWDTRLVKILLKTPLAIALSITDKEEKIWKDDEKSEIIRRNIQYCQWIAPDWYGKAVLYCLNKLQNF